MNKIERLLAKVELPDGCWVWTGAKAVKGYGRIRTGTREDSRTELAHRAMWEAVHGPILGSAAVLHHCDNPPCVRPDHLYLGTLADNARDRDVRARTKSRLTAEQVRLARTAYADGWTNARLARQFGVSDATMHAVVKGRSWRHVV